MEDALGETRPVGTGAGEQLGEASLRQIRRDLEDTNSRRDVREVELRAALKQQEARALAAQATAGELRREVGGMREDERQRAQQMETQLEFLRDDLASTQELQKLQTGQLESQLRALQEDIAALQSSAREAAAQRAAGGEVKSRLDAFAAQTQASHEDLAGSLEVLSQALTSERGERAQEETSIRGSIEEVRRKTDEVWARPAGVHQEALDALRRSLESAQERQSLKTDDLEAKISSSSEALRVELSGALEGGLEQSLAAGRAAQQGIAAERGERGREAEILRGRCAELESKIVDMGGARELEALRDELTAVQDRVDVGLRELQVAQNKHGLSLDEGQANHHTLGNRIDEVHRALEATVPSMRAGLMASLEAGIEKAAQSIAVERAERLKDAELLRSQLDGVMAEISEGNVGARGQDVAHLRADLRVLAGRYEESAGKQESLEAAGAKRHSGLAMAIEQLAETMACEQRRLELVHAEELTTLTATVERHVTMNAENRAGFSASLEQLKREISEERAERGREAETFGRRIESLCRQLETVAGEDDQATRQRREEMEAALQSLAGQVAAFRSDVPRHVEEARASLEASASEQRLKFSASFGKALEKLTNDVEEERGARVGEAELFRHRLDAAIRQMEQVLSDPSTGRHDETEALRSLVAEHATAIRERVERFEANMERTISSGLAEERAARGLEMVEMRAGHEDMVKRCFNQVVTESGSGWRAANGGDGNRTPSTSATPNPAEAASPSGEAPPGSVSQDFRVELSAVKAVVQVVEADCRRYAASVVRVEAGLRRQEAALQRQESLAPRVGLLEERCFGLSTQQAALEAELRRGAEQRGVGGADWAGSYSEAVMTMPAPVVSASPVPMMPPEFHGASLDESMRSVGGPWSSAPAPTLPSLSEGLKDEIESIVSKVNKTLSQSRSLDNTQGQNGAGNSDLLDALKAVQELHAHNLSLREENVGLVEELLSDDRSAAAAQQVAATASAIQGVARASSPLRSIRFSAAPPLAMPPATGVSVVMPHTPTGPRTEFLGAPPPAVPQAVVAKAPGYGIAPVVGRLFSPASGITLRQSTPAPER